MWRDRILEIILNNIITILLGSAALALISCKRSIFLKVFLCGTFEINFQVTYPHPIYRFDLESKQFSKAITKKEIFISCAKAVFLEGKSKDAIFIVVLDGLFKYCRDDEFCRRKEKEGEELTRGYPYTYSRKINIINKDTNTDIKEEILKQFKLHGLMDVSDNIWSLTEEGTKYYKKNQNAAT